MSALPGSAGAVDAGLHAWLDALKDRLGASRWAVAVRDGRDWQVRSATGSLRDDAIVQLTSDPSVPAPDGPRLFDVADLGDAGARLRAAGVDRLLALPSGPNAWLFFDSPDVPRALALMEEFRVWPQPDLAALFTSQDALLDLQDLTAWWLSDEGGRLRLRTTPGTLFANQLQVAANTVATTGDETRRNALLRERARIASVIHEGITQVLTNVAIQLEVLGHASADPAAVTKLVAGSRDAVLQALDSLRSVIFDLTPPTEEWTDLVMGLRGFVADFTSNWGIESRLEIEGDPRLVDAEVVSLAFAFVQEGLTNVRKHAQTSQAHVRLTFGPGIVGVEIRDHGVGLGAGPGEQELREHQGLAIMASRVRLLNGRFHLDSPADGGTSLRMEVPA